MKSLILISAFFTLPSAFAQKTTTQAIVDILSSPEFVELNREAESSDQSLISIEDSLERFKCWSTCLVFNVAFGDHTGASRKYTVQYREILGTPDPKESFEVQFKRK